MTSNYCIGISQRRRWVKKGNMSGKYAFITLRTDGCNHKNRSMSLPCHEGMEFHIVFPWFSCFRCGPPPPLEEGLRKCIELGLGAAGLPGTEAGCPYVDGQHCRQIFFCAVARVWDFISTWKMMEDDMNYHVSCTFLKLRLIRRFGQLRRCSLFTCHRRVIT